MQLPKDVQYLLHCLMQAGFSAYVVGGCVRDSLMGRTPVDWDVCTSATPTEIKKVFCFHKQMEAGIAHGTVGVLINGTQYEITTFRCDGAYLDNRHPESVLFTKDVEKDVLRRDFTINAMAYNDAKGLVDVVGGRADLQKKRLRTVGDPATRFEEDALRIMRCLRFSAILEFAIVPKTASCVIAKAPLLANIAVERINSEFSKLLCGDDCRGTLLTYRSVIEVFLPALRSVPARMYEWRMALLAQVPMELSARLGVFFSLFEVEERLHLLQGLKYSKTIIKDALQYSNFALPVPCEREKLKLLLADVGIDAVQKRLQLQSIAGVKVQVQQALLHSIVEQEDCISLQQLKLNGHQLIAMGYRGKIVGEVLQALLQLVITTHVENEYKVLCDLVPFCLGQIEQAEKSNT